MNSFHQEALEAHNEFRQRHGAPPLVLNEKICQYSQNWAQTLANRDRGGLSLSHSRCNDYGYGENVAGASNNLSGRRSTQMWYDEVKYYRYGSGFSGQTGHFTAVVWKGSKELGVGRAVARSGNVYVVANYKPPGNMTGQFSNNVLPLGTKPPPTPVQAPSQPSKTSTNNVDQKSSSLLTKPVEQSTSSRSSISWVDKPPREIVNAVFDGRLGNCVGNRILRGSHLNVHDYLKSQNGQYIAVLQEDGNFVVYDRNARVYFASNTYKKPTNQVQLRNDGHLTVVDKSNLENPYWKSRNGACGGDCFLIMQDDSNLVAYKGKDVNGQATCPSLAYFSIW